MDVWEEMLGAVRMQQRHKEPRPIRWITSRKQENAQQDFQADCRAGGCEVNSQGFHWAAKNEWLDIVEDLASTQTEKKDAGDTPDSTGTLCVSHSGRAALRWEQRE
jgi:hypothetical protein